MSVSIKNKKQLLIFNNFASLPTTGQINRIYVTADDNKIYRWDGTIYVELSPSTGGGGGGGGAVNSVFTRTGAVVAVSGDYNASQITNTPAGAIVATNVQVAINELDTEKEPTIIAGTTAQYYRGDKTFQILDKSAVGLGNVDNTSDANKPVSTATQNELNLKANLSGATFTGSISATNLSGTNTGDQTNITGNAGTATALQTPRNINGVVFDGTADITITDSTKQPLDIQLTEIANLTFSNDDIIQQKSGVLTNRTPAQLKTDLNLTKGDLGLGNVDNTSDADKPISTATQLALDAKVNYKNDIVEYSQATPELAITDTGKTIFLNYGSPTTLTLPNDAPVGSTYSLIQLGAGQITLSAEAGGTLSSEGGKTKITAQYAGASVVVRTNSGTNAEWFAIGNLTT